MTTGTRRYGEVIGFRPDMASTGMTRFPAPAAAGPAAQAAPFAPGVVVAAYSGGKGGASDLGAHTTHRPNPSLNHEIRSDAADRLQRTPR
jgi:hypothetical protein